MDNFRQTIISQWANSPTLTQLISDFNDWIDPSTDIDNFYDMMWNIDTAQGYGLDVWGRIVGVGRVLQISASNFQGFHGPLGNSGDPFNQSPFFLTGSATTTNFALLDDPFRALILAKALFNICDGSIGAINQILINIFGPNSLLPVVGNSYCTDGLNMTMTYTFGSVLSPVQAAIVFQSGVLPRPAGVFATVVQ